MKNENFEERFIERNIAELSKEYDCIYGANKNIARITADLIDGLKPVQRRALYIMFLKDGGRTFRKLATIAGDVFGRVHPHCLHGDTEFVLTNGKRIKIKDLLNSDNDEILSYDFDRKTIVRSIMHDVRITKYVTEYHEITFTNGGSLKCTEDHRLLVMRKQNNTMAPTWVEAQDLKHGDVLYSAELNKLSNNCINDLKYSSVQVLDINIIKESEPIPMYDFTADDAHNGAVYIADRDSINHSMIIVSNSPTSIEDAIVNIEQSWHNIIPLIEGQGNFGTVSGSCAGASRYIKARLSEYAIACFFEDWKDSVVDMQLAYDEETMMPLYLPAKYPNVLLNGCLGIGLGNSCNIPCFNFREVVEATIKLMKNPNSNIVLIPDSPTGADIIESNFHNLCERGRGQYMQRCTYEIDPEKNMIRITSLPDSVNMNSITEKIADIKEKGGLKELVNMNDLSGKEIDLQLFLRSDVNPYKFIKKLIKTIGGLEKTYPVNITVTYDFKSNDYSIKTLLLEWIRWRREQKRVVVNNKRTTLISNQRTNDIKIFILTGNNLEKTLDIFRNSKNRAEIENRLIERYHNTDIRLDSLQARVLSNMKMVDLSKDARDSYIKQREEIEKELNNIESILNDDNGIDKLIIAELRDGIKRFGEPRRSNVIPYEISVSTEVEGNCILQLSSDGNIIRTLATNVDDDPIPIDSNGFALNVENDESFVLIDEFGYHSFIMVKDIPLDIEVPVNRYSKKSISGNIIAIVPFSYDNNMSCILVSKRGQMKNMKISELKPSNKPCIRLQEGDSIVKGLLVKPGDSRSILIYTKNGLGQRVEINNVRTTLHNAKGDIGFKINNDDEIVGCFIIDPNHNQYLLYTTKNGKMRLNNIEFLPARSSKNDNMFILINISSRDKLVNIVGCNKFDKAKVYFDNGETQEIDISILEESTMGSEPKKVVDKKYSYNNVLKVRIQ